MEQEFGMEMEENCSVETFYFDDGTIQKIMFSVDGIISRPHNQPAIVKYYPNKCLDYIAYVKNGMLHNGLDKPAYIKCFKNGLSNIEIYYQNGVLHRLNGYAFIVYNEQQEIIQQFKFFNGINVDDCMFYLPPIII